MSTKNHSIQVQELISSTTPKEEETLAFFIAHPHQFFSTGELEKEFKRTKSSIGGSISGCRRYMHPDGLKIYNVKGGYIFTDEIKFKAFEEEYLGNAKKIRDDITVVILKMVEHIISHPNERYFIASVEKEVGISLDNSGISRVIKAVEKELSRILLMFDEENRSFSIKHKISTPPIKQENKDNFYFSGKVRSTEITYNENAGLSILIGGKEKKLQGLDGDEAKLLVYVMQSRKNKDFYGIPLSSLYEGNNNDNHKKIIAACTKINAVLRDYGLESISLKLLNGQIK